MVEGASATTAPKCTKVHQSSQPVEHAGLRLHPGPGPYMHDTYPPYLDQGLIQTVSTVSGPRYS